MDQVPAHAMLLEAALFLHVHSQDNGAAAVESEKSHQEVNDAELVDLAVLGRLAECDAGAAPREAAPARADRAVGAVAPTAAIAVLEGLVAHPFLLVLTGVLDAS
eukprot:CAMPEP_0172558058 /NCGR_PEP_ID=MMETSP1067-20121228/77037_1 /TAXON_ID=265564 ORGANISM="Thalassiosira punctigera, Strain Tpunct2005C2" /NCGR_SAMPLE_ID=MMETSP1067 /ASSEMBLY_ACC=CAM_ASM_000444 /LENGTH=104 /DNA_ID=CAMNT_0013347325 /DNA_START=180 /DNA_END=494 /DNA_ORIENTATION=-